ncbi:hypothetical protein [uncultured Pseudokineococcus sp.]|uniref:hypothetical protein n=1 Tax=uncultured Pseudokineococcus sp. TaxID=1642928 RepID=UPI0026349483|nr:hypothetical protein [uncultured Pseudokineococcus sp.]
MPLPAGSGTTARRPETAAAAPPGERGATSTSTVAGALVRPSAGATYAAATRPLAPATGRATTWSPSSSTAATATVAAADERERHLLGADHLGRRPQHRGLGRGDRPERDRARHPQHGDVDDGRATDDPVGVGGGEQQLVTAAAARRGQRHLAGPGVDGGAGGVPDERVGEGTGAGGARRRDAHDLVGRGADDRRAGDVRGHADVDGLALDAVGVATAYRSRAVPLLPVRAVTARTPVDGASSAVTGPSAPTSRRWVKGPEPSGGGRATSTAPSPAASRERRTSSPAADGCTSTTTVAGALAVPPASRTR